VETVRTLPLENGSRESIHPSAGLLDATGRPEMQVMSPRSADLSDGPRRPCQEHGAPVFREDATTALSSAARTPGPNATKPTQR
jgi:hypothetical protein